MFDLWGGEEESNSAESAVVKRTSETETVGTIARIDIPENMDCHVSLDTENILIVTSTVDFSKHRDFVNLGRTLTMEPKNGVYSFEVELRPTSAFVLRYLLKGLKCSFDKGLLKKIRMQADRVFTPTATLSDDGKHIVLHIPNISVYRDVNRLCNGYPVNNGDYRINIAKLFDLESALNNWDSNLPKIALDDSIFSLMYDPIEGFDGTLDSMKNISVDQLNVVKANSQSYKAVKKSEKSIAEKMKSMKIETLYDLLTWLPRRYIDKSRPQNIYDLQIDEQATVMGEITSVRSIPNNMGVCFTVTTSTGNNIDVNFWRRDWLRTKFKIGDEVIVTGKFGIWNRKPNLSGTSIDNAKDVASLPIVPVYKQSETRGITTAFILAAIREVFARVEKIELPAYYPKNESESLYEAYRELHLPSSSDSYKKASDYLAYLEMIDRQILILEENQRDENIVGIEQNRNPDKDFQEKAIATLPFDLTHDQKVAIADMNAQLSSAIATKSLLNADVGAGKSIVAQLVCLRSVEAGHQAVLLGPTDVLAKQLYKGFVKLLNSIPDVDINIAYYSGSMKAPEKKIVQNGLKDGSIDIVVGTHGLLSPSVKYNDLGFVCIDEQQKFGSVQRTSLLSRRTDGLVPDIMNQSATPIPASVAQIFYGGIHIIKMMEKPPGRIEIETKLITENPNELLEQLVNPLWDDIEKEVEKGNQAFVITPMVKDSEKVDAASVERTYKILSSTIFNNLNVGFLHGQMKSDEQEKMMEDFRNKKYDIMVASTIVEVGVDIPDATRVVILSADRLGASSIHQIRGRVGRSNKPSVCYLVSNTENNNAVMRLQSIVDNPDGFSVAQADLLLRGEGKMFSESQSGATDMIFASLVTHGDMIDDARKEAQRILASSYRNQAIEEAKERVNFEGSFV